LRIFRRGANGVRAAAEQDRSPDRKHQGMKKIVCFIGSLITTLLLRAVLPVQSSGTPDTATERAIFTVLLVLSHRVMSTDRQHALVYRVEARGPQNGRTDLFLMQRRPGSDEWSVVKALPISIS
jgi:hypothetical protein